MAQKEVYRRGRMELDTSLLQQLLMPDDPVPAVTGKQKQQRRKKNRQAAQSRARNRR